MVPQVSPEDYKRLQWGESYLKATNFFAGSLLVWLPEFIYTHVYRDGRPPCKWCGWSDCVIANDFLNPAGPCVTQCLRRRRASFCGSHAQALGD